MALGPTLETQRLILRPPVRGDGGFDLLAWPAIAEWLSQVRATPRFAAMPAVGADGVARLALSN